MSGKIRVRRLQALDKRRVERHRPGETRHVAADRVPGPVVADENAPGAEQIPAGLQLQKRLAFLMRAVQINDVRKAIYSTFR